MKNIIKLILVLIIGLLISNNNTCLANGLNNTPKINKVLEIKDQNKIFIDSGFNVSNNEEWITYNINTINKGINLGKQYLKNQKTGKIYYLGLNTGNVSTPKFSPNSKYLGLNMNDGIKIINLTTLKSNIYPHSMENGYGNVDFLSDNIFIVGSKDKIHLFNINGTHKILKNIKSENDNAFVVNGKIISGSSDININGKTVIAKIRNGDPSLKANGKYIIYNQRNYNTLYQETFIYNIANNKSYKLGIDFLNGVISNDDIIYYIKSNGVIGKYDIISGFDTDLTKEKIAGYNNCISNNGITLIGNNLYFTSRNSKMVLKISVK